MTTMPKLKAKQRAFVCEYLKDFNGRQAAIRAGYAANSAVVTASRLLSKANIAAALAEAKAEARREAIMSFEEMCETLTRVARAKLTDFIGTDGAIDIRKGEALALQGVEQLVDREGNPILKIRKVDGLRALDQLAKLMGYNAPTKVAPTDPSGELPYQPLTTEELFEVAARIHDRRGGADGRDAGDTPESD